MHTIKTPDDFYRHVACVYADVLELLNIDFIIKHFFSSLNLFIWRTIVCPISTFMY